MAGALRLLEDADVDLAAEHLVHATHEATAGALVVEEVQVGAARLDAARGMNEPIAEGAALPALMCGCALTGRPRHQISVAAGGLRRWPATPLSERRRALPTPTGRTRYRPPGAPAPAGASALRCGASARTHRDGG